ncbi:hypothetical protein [Colwellia sp. C1TZA3]|uniref:hypothetical protein n=1 Tax=Colwellia sp. C1TZA3 TaxID=2508879 RepID=UPI0011B981A7|nr:hypothetical protein [Colwellia sp. C1TZA3]TWX73155.1 hypothetical protein ESZ39_05130 [Colwellia sp. C1TZA3]
MKKKLIASLALLISACSSVKYNYIPNSSVFSIPSLNVEISSGLGEPLLDQGKATKREVIYITQETSLAAYKIKPGKLFKIGSDQDFDYFSQDILSGYSIYEGLIVSTPSVTSTLRHNKTNGEVCILRPIDIDICGQIMIRKDTENVITNDSFRRTLIYSGRVGNKLKISYREFSNNMARSAFSSEVEYDLGESDLIGYAGARIKVISATNTEIKYKVISNFNLHN